MNNPMNHRGGFTLVEALAVVGIVLVLTALLVEVGSWGRKKSLVNLTASELSSMKLAVQKYYQTTRQLPPDGIEGLTGALLPMSLYPFVENRMVVPDYLQAEKARLQERLAELERQTADAEKRLADARAGGGGPDSPPPEDPELVRRRDGAVATAVLHIRGAPRGSDLDHPSYQDLLTERKQLLRLQQKRGLSPEETQELAAAEARIAEYERDIQEAMRLTGLDDPDLATRFRNTVGRSDHLTLRYGAEMCRDPGIVLGALKHVSEHGERARFYTLRFAETHNREITEEMVLEVLDVIRRAEGEWEVKHGEEPWELRESIDTIYGCIKKSIAMVYNGVDPKFDRIWKEKYFADYIKGEAIEEIRRIVEDTDSQDQTLQDVIKTRGDRREYDPWGDVGGPCVRQLLENRTYQVEEEYLFDRKGFKLRYDDPPYPGGAPGDGEDPPRYPDPGTAIENELARLREAYVQTQDALAGLDFQRTYFDAWGNPFVYEEVRVTGIREGVQADAGEPFVIYSAGPDGRYHTVDDVRPR